jgi:hypothetical protein
LYRYGFHAGCLSSWGGGSAEEKPFAFIADILDKLRSNGVPNGIAVAIKFLSKSLSSNLDPALGASDAVAPVIAAPDGLDDATGAATGLALDEIPMLPVSESNNPPTDGDTLTTTSGSTVSPEMMSPNA